MKKQLCLLICLVLTSCAAVVNLDNRVKELELGMTKQESIKMLGNNYIVELKSLTPEGEVEVLKFESSVGYSDDYILRFLNGRLMEYYRYIPPVHPEVHVINKEESKN